MVNEINPVRAATIPGGAPYVESAPQAHSSKCIKHIKSALDWSSTTLKIVHTVGFLFNNLAHGLAVGFKCTQIPSILLFPYTTKDLIGNVKKIVSPDAMFYGKVKAGLESITNVDDLVCAVAATFQIFITAKVISDTVGCWMPYFFIADVFVCPISVWLKGDSVFNLHKLKKELDSLIKDAEGSSPATVAKKWDDVLARVEKEDAGALRTQHSISKKANLAARVAALRTALQAPGDTTKAVKESADLMKVLAPRILKQFGYELVELVNKVAITGGMVFVTFTPFFIFGISILIASASVSLVLMAGRAMLIHKNPFDENLRSRAETLLDLLIPSRKEVRFLRKEVRDLTAKKEEAQRLIQDQETKIRALEAEISRQKILEEEISKQKEEKEQRLIQDQAKIQALEAEILKAKKDVSVKMPSVAERIKLNPRTRRPVTRFLVT